MPVEDTLARVEADLASGRVRLARQRVRGLVGQFPDRLDLRDQLAELYRRDGDLAQAGRWGYLHDHPDPKEVAAFRRAYGDDPVKLMQMLRWRAGEDSAPSPEVRARLRALREEAEMRVGAPVAWVNPEPPKPGTTLRGRIGTVFAAGGCLLVLGLSMIGIYALITMGISTVVDWLT